MTLANVSRVLLLGGVFAFASAAAEAATETVVYSFQNNGKDAMFPGANLIDVNGTLYGTTEEGGTGRCENGCGTIFSVNAATGAETVLYSFLRTAPMPGALVRLGDKLFGGTQAGGHRGGGMLFSLDPKSDAFKQRYYFCNLYDCSDVENPNSGLLISKGPKKMSSPRTRGPRAWSSPDKSCCWVPAFAGMTG